MMAPLTEANQDLTSLAFDLYQSYSVLRAVGPSFTPPGAPFRVLDVGGLTPVYWKGSRSLAGEMLPGATAVVVDVQPAVGLANGVRARAVQLPFPDASIDLVCSFDTLEHLRREDRIPCLRELLRVTRDGLLLAFPFDSPVNRAAEKMLSDFIELYYQTSIPQLEEHNQFGLPDRAEVAAFLAGSGCPTLSFSHGNTDVWLLMMLTQQSLRISRCDALVESLNRRFNLGPAAQDWAEPAYRVFFLVSKKKTHEELQALEVSLRDQRGEAAADAVLPLCRLLLETAHRGRVLADRDRHIRDLEAALGAAGDVTARLKRLSQKVEATSRQVEALVGSRIWKTLCALGGLMLKIRRPLALEDVRLVCNEPVAGDRTPKSGTLVVSGWALAPSGIDAIDVQADREPALPAQLDPPRAGDERSVYRGSVDTKPLANGIHAIRIRATSRRGATCEAMVDVCIDHEKGFASPYERWMAEFERSQDALARLQFKECARRPLISVLMPVINTPRVPLERAIASVREQSYEDWELCIADDGSDSADVAAVLRQCEQDPRIKLAQRARRGGISAASNTALELATGEYVALLDHDDELSPEALLHVVVAINHRPAADLIYSDEDKLDGSGRRCDPFFKPDWSPDLLLCENYICHLLVAPTGLVRAVGGFRSEYDGSQDYDLILRLTRQAREVVHVPAVLYHWRVWEGSAALDLDAKPYAEDAARRALEDHLRYAGIAGRVEPGVGPNRWRVRYTIPENSRVSVLIPSGGKVDLLRTNLAKLAAKTDYADYEIVVIDNSRGDRVRRLVQGWEKNGRRARYLDLRSMPFNYAALNNEAARSCDSPLLLFLNDDTEVIAPDWLTAMVELGARPEVGAVGAKLLYRDGRIQHAGVVMGLGGECGHAFYGLNGRARHYLDFPDLIRDVSAVTGACLLVRASVFREVGGFDEAHFPVSYNDIDLCLRIGQKGYRVVYTPHAVLYHHESLSRTGRHRRLDPAEVLAIQTKWKDVIAADPFYNPNLTRTGTDYSFRRRD